MKDDFDQFLPLSPAALHILLALAGEERHGYGIMREVARQSEGRYKLGPGTLYDNLQKMLDQGIVEEPSPRSSGDDPRRRYYRLSRFGRGLLARSVASTSTTLRSEKPIVAPSKAWSAKRGYILKSVRGGHDDPHLVSLAHLLASTRLSPTVRARASLDIRRIS